MYDGSKEVYDEVKENARVQQHPLVRGLSMHPTLQMPALSPGPQTVFGLSTRQMELLNNNDTGQPNQGEGRRRRIETIIIEIDYINTLLPNLEKVRAYLAGMPVEGDEDLQDAKRLADQKLKAFDKHVTSKLETLELELSIKREEE